MKLDKYEKLSAWSSHRTYQAIADVAWKYQKKLTIK